MLPKSKEIIATVSAEKAANLPQQMIENIAKGRLGKFLKEVCLLNQEDIMDGKKTVKETMKEADPELADLGIQTLYFAFRIILLRQFEIKKEMFFETSPFCFYKRISQL